MHGHTKVWECVRKMNELLHLYDCSLCDIIHAVCHNIE